MKKILMPVLIVLVVAVLVIFTSRNVIFKVGLEKGVAAVTGLQLGVEKVDVDIANTYVNVAGLKLYNPPKFEENVMIEVPEIHVDYDIFSLLRGKVHLNELRLNLKEFIVVKNSDGELNLNSIDVVKHQKKDKPEEVVKDEKKELPEIRIDVLDLRVGKVTYKDYSRSPDPRVREFNININERFYDIDDPEKLVSLIIVQALSRTAVARLADFDLSSLEGTISETLARAQNIMDGAGDIVSRAGEAAEQMRETVGDAAESVRDTFQGLAGALRSSLEQGEE